MGPAWGLPLCLQLVEQQEDTQLWNEFIERHHYLGYRQPLGRHLRYFLLDRHGRRLGCVLFSQASHSLAYRDEWVGWPAGEYKKHLDLVVGQPRFLLFPWVLLKKYNFLQAEADRAASGCSPHSGDADGTRATTRGCPDRRLHPALQPSSPIAAPFKACAEKVFHKNRDKHIDINITITKA